MMVIVATWLRRTEVERLEFIYIYITIYIFIHFVVIFNSKYYNLLDRVYLSSLSISVSISISLKNITVIGLLVVLFIVQFAIFFCQV